jgi:hypothetical protein
MPVTFKKEISWGAIVQIATFIISGVVFWDRVATQQKEIIDGMREDRQRIERIEKYLSSKDSHYWELIQKMSFEEERRGNYDPVRHAAAIAPAIP